MRKFMLAVLAITLMSSPVYAAQGWIMVAYEDITSPSQKTLHAVVRRAFFSSEAQCLIGKGALENTLTNAGRQQVNVVCAFVPEQR